MLSGDNGILQKATDAKIETEKGQEKEIVVLAYNSALAKKVGNGISGIVTGTDLNVELTSQGASAEGDNPIIVTFDSGNSYSINDNGQIQEYTPPQRITIAQAKSNETIFDSNTTLIDDYENKVVVPKGFKISGDSADNVTGGVVIEDATYTNTIGSQFVWIPIGNVTGEDYTGTLKTEIITLDRCGFNSDGNKVTVKEGWEYQLSKQKEAGMPDDMVEINRTYVFSEELKTENGLGISGNHLSKDISEFISSVNTNGGFWIGRYEARKNTTGNVTENKNNNIFKSINQSTASESSKQMYNSNMFVSDLINSYAWDTTVFFLQTFGEAKYSIKNSVNSGSVSNKGTLLDHPCNVYDMASNCLEFSTESCSNSNSPCTLRGGGIYSGFCSGRTIVPISLSSDVYSFRPIIYLK